MNNETERAKYNRKIQEIKEKTAKPVKPLKSDGLTYAELNKTIEFLITYHLIDYQEALKIRTKAMPYLKG